MKRKEKSLLEFPTTGPLHDETNESGNDAESADRIPAPRDDASAQPDGDKFFYLEEGRVQFLSPRDYTPSTVYQLSESFVVERKFVKPEDPGNILYEGKKPSRKTVPILVTRDGGHVILNSWEDLEGKPEQLAEVSEVIGATPVRQVFVLRKK